MIGKLTKAIQAKDLPINVVESPLPALRIGKNGEIVEQSASAAALVLAWQSRIGELPDVCVHALNTGLMQEARIKNPDGNSFWLVVVPDNGGLILIARDTSLPDQMLTALVKSRNLLRSLLDLSADFAFEVDEAGRFQFVTPEVAFGQPTSAWVGQSGRRIFWPNGGAPAFTPFDVVADHHFEAMTIELSPGHRFQVDFEIELIKREDGTVAGLRGVGRDVTERIQAERKARMLNLRLSVQSRITSLLSSANSSDELLDRAAKIIMDTLRADMVWMYVDYGEGMVPVSIERASDDVDLGPGVTWNSLDPNLDWEDLRRSGMASLGQAELGGVQLLSVNLKSGDARPGMMIVGRDTNINPWSDQEKDLLIAVGDILAAAFSKATLFDRLNKLSSRDELTDVMNRRGFEEAINRRLKHQMRTNEPGILMIVDLDFFKQVNDTLGHRAGDDALIMVANYLKTSVRACDHVGRYGGDEFVVWVEHDDIDLARRKAQGLIDHMSEVRQSLGNEDLQLSASVGIALSTTEHDKDFRALLGRADKALYDVKKAGKANVAVAPDAAKDKA